MSAIAEQAAQVASMAKALAAAADTLARAISANGWEPEELAEGHDLGITDADGNPLTVGDRVQILGSDRYGDPYAVVKGPGPDLDDFKVRVHVALEDGQDDTYTPSVGRVHLVPAVAAE